MKHVWLGVLAWVLALPLSACAEDGGDEGNDNGPAQCGEVTCGSNEYCCDASCGLCVENEVACNMTCAE